MIYPQSVDGLSLLLFVQDPTYSEVDNAYGNPDATHQTVSILG